MMDIIATNTTYRGILVREKGGESTKGVGSGGGGRECSEVVRKLEQKGPVDSSVW